METRASKYYRVELGAPLLISNIHWEMARGNSGFLLSRKQATRNRSHAKLPLPEERIHDM